MPSTDDRRLCRGAGASRRRATLVSASRETRSTSVTGIALGRLSWHVQTPQIPRHTEMHCPEMTALCRRNNDNWQPCPASSSRLAPIVLE